MGGSYPKRGSYDYIKNKTEETFFNPETATKELVDEVFDIVNDRNKIIRVLAMSKSAIRQNLSQDLKVINQPTLLIWGKNDIVTPPEVCEEFHKLIPQSEIAWVDRCGHAPMMEYPDHFNDILADWLTKKGL
jgi:pimeloyl-ACP methyl ester carboxylesterase